MASLTSNIAPVYNSGTSYTAGSKVLYNDHLYNCTKATSGAFDSTAWTEIYLADLLNSNLGGNGVSILTLAHHTLTVTGYSFMYYNASTNTSGIFTAWGTTHDESDLCTVVSVSWNLTITAKKNCYLLAYGNALVELTAGQSYQISGTPTSEHLTVFPK